MSVTTGPKKALIISAADGDAFGTYFRAQLRALDTLLLPYVIDHTLAAPPGGPTNGQAYIVAAGPSGAWTGHAGAIAVWSTDNPAAPTGEWEFYPPETGWVVFSRNGSAQLQWSGSAWLPLMLPAFTVANLPAAPAAGSVAYASNGRKTGEGAGLGTGVPCYFSSGNWRRYSDDTAVAA
ncbi:MAG: DUF2793 domain-containing protein [Acidobacteriia bacterium]|nr:DUF2793 domain-containing protein [Terriglobia bacterium]